MLADPGDPLASTNYMKRLEAERKVGAGGDELAWCNYCSRDVKKLSKHCWVCDKCVDGFDHHCKWLNTCIGAANYANFYRLLLVFLAFLVIQLVTSLVPFVISFDDADTICRRVQGVHGECDITNVRAWLGVHMAVTFLLFLFAVKLWVFHLELQIKGMTTYEWILWARIERAPTEDDRNYAIESLRSHYPGSYDRHKHRLSGSSSARVAPLPIPPPNNGGAASLIPSPMELHKPAFVKTFGGGSYKAESAHNNGEAKGAGGDAKSPDGAKPPEEGTGAADSASSNLSNDAADNAR